jgi:eukaryotic-like serine/threonine-protein kinase
VTAEEWREVAALVEEAGEIAAGPERDAFLRRACAGRAWLEQEVCSLLEADPGGKGVLDDPPGLRLAMYSRQDTLIGPYRLAELIGRGGMGAVYRAERWDGEYEKQVAVKVIQSVVPTEEIRRRFLEERQILAGLDHPNLARLLDGGTTASGEPYIVMEYVDGLPVTGFALGLPVRDRLRLFLRICAAVDYAHRRLVVHRDIKPANILVTKEGEPKLLDFGIAKALDVLPETAETVLALTPQYAAPEQIRRRPVTTATDVYSLGVVLYELLAGHPPYETAGKGMDEVVRLVCEAEPPAIATVDADLTAILRKATEKDPDARYPSAAALAEDIERYLGGHPVAARRGCAWYATRKYIARHRRAMVLAGLCGCALMGAGGIVLWQARVAKQRFDMVRALAGAVIFEMHDAIEKLPGATPVRKQLVSRGLEYLDTLAEEAGRDHELPLELAAGYLKLGEVLGRVSSNHLGDPAGAKAAWAKTERLALAAVDRSPENPEAPRLLAAVHTYLAEMEGVAGNAGETQRRRAEALRWAERMVELSPAGDARALRALASAYFGYSNTLGSERHDDSIEYMRKALGAFEALQKMDPESDGARRNVALCLKRLGSQLSLMGSRTEGLPLLRRAREIDSERVSRDPNNAQARLDLAITISEVAVHLAADHKTDEAARLFRESVELRRALYQADAMDVRSRARFVHGLLNLADAERQMGRFTAALALYQQAIQVEGKGSAERLLWAYTGMGEADLASGRPEAACAAFREARRWTAAIPRMSEFYAERALIARKHCP